MARPAARWDSFDCVHAAKNNKKILCRISSSSSCYVHTIESCTRKFARLRARGVHLSPARRPLNLLALPGLDTRLDCDTNRSMAGQVRPSRSQPARSDLPLCRLLQQA
jgi:hypothetical protein